jgi:hypothetical protein
MATAKRSGERWRELGPQEVERRLADALRAAPFPDGSNEGSEVEDEGARDGRQRALVQRACELAGEERVPAGPKLVPFLEGPLRWALEDVLDPELVAAAMEQVRGAFGVQAPVAMSERPTPAYGTLRTPEARTSFIRPREERATPKSAMPAAGTAPTVVILSPDPNASRELEADAPSGAVVEAAQDLFQLSEVLRRRRSEPLTLVFDFRTGGLDEGLVSLCGNLLPAGSTAVVWGGSSGVQRWANEATSGGEGRFVPVAASSSADDIWLLMRRG